MHGGVILFRGSGTDARRYLESDRSRADEYYLESGVALAEFSVVDGSGTVIGDGALTPDEYAQWVDWINPFTGESMGTPRLPGNGRQGSPRFAEMVVNAPKSLSIAAALHPDVSDALDAAQKDAMSEIRSWLGQHSVTRVGPRGRQEVVSVEQLETVSVVHKTSRAGDPHRHIHFQIGTRVWAAGAWRGLDTGALFKQQGAIRALGTAVIAAHPRLAAVLDAHGLTLDPVTGEVAELEPFNAMMSKRGEQVKKNLARFQAEWEARHPGQEPGPVVMSRLTAMAWDHERPAKKPSNLKNEAGWRAELEAAGYTPNLPRQHRAPASLDDLHVQEVAARALDRCAAAASTWTRHTVQEHVTRITTETGVRATPKALREFIKITTQLATEDCLSVLPPGTVQPEHVAHLTSVHVVKVETELRDLLSARAAHLARNSPDVSGLARELDADQTRAAAAVASDDPLVVVEGAAGAGKTTMLGVAIQAAAAEGRATRLVTPTKKAAQVAMQELGVPADSVAKLVYTHGFRWNRDGVWTRLAIGQTDPDTGATYTGPPAGALLARGERIVVDEAGMLDQDTALALLTIADEAGATLALVGDRAQLPAVGRGGVLDMAAQLVSRTFDMTTVHRFTDPAYAEVTVQMRAGENPAVLFESLHALGLIQLHENTEHLHEAIAQTARVGDVITAATNDETRNLNALIREERVRRGEVNDVHTATGNDGLLIGAGDVIQARKNDSTLGVANRQNWIVQLVSDDGTVWAKDAATGRKHQHTGTLPAEYVAEHAHLAYASTAYGVQGATVQESHTVLSDALDAAGVYVGMTRGSSTNQLHIVAESLDDAREQFAAALERDRADRGLIVATEAAQVATRGLMADGPVKFVTMERARLLERAERFEAEAARFEEAATRFARHKTAHDAESQAHARQVAEKAQIAEEARQEITTQTAASVVADVRGLTDAHTRLRDARIAAGSARLGTRRSRTRVVVEAQERLDAIRTNIAARWGSAPDDGQSVTAWATKNANEHTNVHPEVQEAEQAATAKKAEARHIAERHTKERTQLTVQVYGAERARQMLGTFRIPNPATDAKLARQRAAEARKVIAELDARPIAEATAWLTSHREAQRVERETLATRRAALSAAEPINTKDREKPGLGL